MGNLADRWLRTILATLLNQDPIYIAIFLTPMDHRRLVKRFGQKHSELHAHHMTIWYQGDDSDPPALEDLPLGRLVALKVTGYVEDDKGQAVLVQPPTKLRPGLGRIPHVTISTALGVGPVYSNTMLQQYDERVAGFPKLQGRVGWWDGTQVRFDLAKQLPPAFRGL